MSTGTLVPTGALRDAIKRGDLNTAQLSYVLRPQLALTTTFGWARSRNLASATNSKLDVFTYDVGTEFRAEPRKLSEKVIFQPFAGVGVGGRSYDDHSLGASATHRAALYGSVGGEVGYGRVRLRLEARDNVSGFKSLDGRGTTSTGNDVTVMLGLRIALGKK